MAYTGITGTVQGAAPNNDPGVICGANIDLSGVLPAGQVGNCFSADGQLWIGSTALSAGGTHSKIGTLTPGTGISITNGSGSITISSNGVNDLHTAKFIVSSEGTLGTGANFTTISAAIASAQGTGLPSTIFIMPGTYTENFTLPSGINLTSFTCDSQTTTPNVTIFGKITGSAGLSVISNIQIKNNASDLISGGSSLVGLLLLKGCQLLIQGTGNSGINSNALSVTLIDCNLILNGTNVNYFAMSGSSTLRLYNCTTSSGGSPGVVSTVSNSAGLIIYYSQILEAITSSNTAQLDFRHSSFGATSINNTILTANGTGTTNSALNCEFLHAGTGNPISVGAGVTFTLSNCSINSTATNAITGAGTIKLSNVSFNNTSSTVNTSTQVPLIASNDAIKVVTPGAYPYTTTAQDAIILVDTSSARTITPLASPTIGQRHIIKDSVGSAAVNNITVTPSGKNIDGAASYTINSNYGSITIVYNGTEWSVI